MPSQVIPIEQLHQAGVVFDTPRTILAPNIFTDARNVRFRDLAVRKIEGEIDLGFPIPANQELLYVAWWPSPALSPSNGYYILVTTHDDTDSIYVAHANDTDTAPRLLKSEIAGGGTWQHTIFSGGYAFILNNGVEKPMYILDNATIGSLRIYDLPGWDSYQLNQAVISETFAPATRPEFNLGRLIDFNTERVFVEIRNSNNSVIATGTFSSNGTIQGITVATESATNTTTVTPAQTGANAVSAGDSVVINYRSPGPTVVRAGVIRAYGDLLVAGNLTELDTDNNVLRNLAGVVRTSNVAPAGSVPTNWNPFAIGAGTADEFVLSTAGIVQDLVELQGRLIVYTDTGIHSIQPTGSTAVPFNTSTVTDSYGALTTNGVIDFDGQHVVVGSNDIYLFSGHPGNIQSIADARIREYFFDRLSAEHEDNLFMFRNKAKDEIWICYPVDTETCTEALIWNYRINNWTVRDLPNIRYADVGPVAGGNDSDRDWATNTINPARQFPIMAGSSILAADIGYQFSGSNYTSYIERQNLALAPEFNVEAVQGLALWAEGEANLDIKIQSTNVPSDVVSLGTRPVDARFRVGGNDADYKADLRITGRFLNYRIQDNATSTGWNIAGMQIEIMTGGRR